MLEEELRRYCCCFTGHRPEKLSGLETKAIESLNKEIRIAVADGFQVFISGMARGVDLWAAEAILAMREEGTALQLICASPYPGFESRWSQKWQERYQWVMAQADLVCFISKCYHRGCFQRRNEWMVNRSARVIAIYNGQSGETRNTIEYAKAHRVQMICPAIF